MRGDILEDEEGGFGLDFDRFWKISTGEWDGEFTLETVLFVAEY
jgi:hypothetical protein